MARRRWKLLTDLISTVRTIPPEAWKKLLNNAVSIPLTYVAVSLVTTDGGATVVSMMIRSARWATRTTWTAVVRMDSMGHNEIIKFFVSLEVHDSCFSLKAITSQNNFNPLSWSVVARKIIREGYL